MVLSGFTIPRAFSCVVCAIVLFASHGAARAQSSSNTVAGTLPEDYLPELKEILATALLRSPDVIARDFARLVQEARTIQADAPRLPQFGGNFNYGITQTATATNTNSKSKDDGFFYNFGLNQALFHWGALRNQSIAARIALLVTQKDFALAYREFSVLLRKMYLGLIVEQARLNHLRGAFELVRDDVSVAIAKRDMGTMSSADVEGEKLRASETELDVKRAEAEFIANWRRFARVAGMPTLGEARVPRTIPRPAYSEPQVTQLAATVLKENARSTLEYEIYDLRIRETQLRQKIEAVRLFPKFGASANYSLEQTTNVVGNFAEQRAVSRQSIAIGGSWPIFDGFATKGAKREALVGRHSAEHNKAMRIEELLQNVQALERTLKLDAEQLTYSDVRRELATEARRQIEEEVKFGNLARYDVDRAQVGVLLADVQNLATRAAYLGHWSEFVAAATDDPVLANLPARYYARAQK